MKFRENCVPHKCALEICSTFIYKSTNLSTTCLKLGLIPRPLSSQDGLGAHVACFLLERRNNVYRFAFSSVCLSPHKGVACNRSQTNPPLKDLGSERERERERGGTSHHAIAHANSTQTELASEKHGAYIKTPDICLQSTDLSKKAM